MFAKIPSNYHVLTWKEKEKNLFLFCIRKEWHTDIRHVLLMRTLFCVLATESFISLMVLLSMYFGTMYDDCCSVTSDLTSPILFSTSPMDDCFLKSQHPKMYKSLFIKLLDQVSLNEACCFSWVLKCFWIWKLCLINSYLWIVFQLTMMTISVIETHFEKVE